MKEVKTLSFWTLKLGSHEDITMPVWIVVASQLRDRQHSEKLNNDTIYRPSVTSAQCIIGTEKHPDSALSLNNDDECYSQGYGKI